MSRPLHVAFVWHMHQPYYRDVATGRCGMPWVRLHATKDYLDMVTRLELFPSIHQTFNLVPSLLDQLEDYLPPASRSDDFLERSRKSADSLSEQEQRFLLQWFFLANTERMIKPYPRYHDLLVKRGLRVSDEQWPKIQKRFQAQDYLDLQVWFNLAWIDPWLRGQDSELAGLEAKGSHFTEIEKRYVLEQHVRLIERVIPAYRNAAARGTIELTTSPYYHPIMPLLCDVRVALAALPQLPMPAAWFRHPEAARWQLQSGLERQRTAFGLMPRGVWPPEGGVSEEFAGLAIEANVQWIAADEEILWRTLKQPRSPVALYRPYALRRKSGQLAVIFRDRELSDLIGFVYSQWDPQVAVSDFMRRLDRIHQQLPSSDHPGLVSVVLDGENAWECYPRDGHEFLVGLYQALASDGRFRCVTVGEFLAQYPVDQAETLPPLSSGSWIDGNFATWVGHPEKNAAWEQLSHAREALTTLGRDEQSYPLAWQSLRIAEGSDWMWWFGDTHFTAQAEDFDLLFRTHLSNCYRLADLPVPDALRLPVRRKNWSAVSAPTGLVHPVIDGRETSYYEWLFAGSLDLTRQYSASHRSEQCVRRLYYGCDETHQYFRIDMDPSVLRQVEGWSIEMSLSAGLRVRVTQGAAGVRGQVTAPVCEPLACAAGRILELAIPRKVLKLQRAEHLQLALAFVQHGETLERYPAQGAFDLVTSESELRGHVWSV